MQSQVRNFQSIFWNSKLVLCISLMAKLNVKYFALAPTSDPWQLLGRLASPRKMPWKHIRKKTLQTTPYTMTGGEKESYLWTRLGFPWKGPSPCSPSSQRHLHDLTIYSFTICENTEIFPWPLEFKQRTGALFRSQRESRKWGMVGFESRGRGKKVGQTFGNAKLIQHC